MNAVVAATLLRGALAGNHARLALAITCIALGVALAGAVHTIHSSALAEIDRAARSLSGSAELDVRGPRSGFDEQVFALVSKRSEVELASPVVEFDAPLASGGAALRVMGIDAFRAARLQPGFLAGAADTGLGNATTLLDRRNAWLTPTAISRLGLKTGDKLLLASGTSVVELRVAGAMPALGDAGALAVIDIATAQEEFGRIGRLSRIALRLRPGTDVAAFRASLAAQLPPGVLLETSDAPGGQVAALTRAYRVNLNALALVALATGMFLVFATLALQAARRRREFALLRALGLTRRGLAVLVLIEGALVGATGAAIGTGLGLLAVQALLHGFGPDLGGGFFRGADPILSPDSLALAGIAALGIATAMAGAWLVARSVVRQDVAEGLRERAQDLPGNLARQPWFALAFVFAGIACLLLPPFSGLPLGGYAGIACWLAAGVLAVAPACRALLARLPLDSHPIATLAAAQVRELPGHLAAAVAGIVVAASLCVAMAIMVFSFRASLDDWLRGVVGADLYARAGVAGDSGYFDDAEQRRIAALPGIMRSEAMRYDRLALEGALTPVTLIARPIDERILSGFQVSPPRVPARGEHPAAWVSQAAIELHGWRPGMQVSLPVAGRNLTVAVAGVFRDYARTWGAVLIDLDDYRRHTGDLRANDLAIDLAGGTRVPAAIEAIRAALPGARNLAFEDAKSIQQRSLAIFDRTFAATYALEAVALVIALAGVTSSFAALAWSRRREFGVLRHLGLTRGDVLKLLALEGGVAGALGAAMGLVLGAAISLVLVHVVSRQSFHWEMEVHWPWVPLAGLAAAIVVLCALGARLSGAAAVRDEAIHAVKDDA